LIIVFTIYTSINWKILLQIWKKWNDWLTQETLRKPLLRLLTRYTKAAASQYEVQAPQRPVYAFTTHHHGLRQRENVDSPATPKRHQVGIGNDKSSWTSTGRKRSRALLRVPSYKLDHGPQLKIQPQGLYYIVLYFFSIPSGTDTS